MPQSVAVYDREGRIGVELVDDLVHVVAGDVTDDVRRRRCLDATTRISELTFAARTTLGAHESGLHFNRRTALRGRGNSEASVDQFSSSAHPIQAQARRHVVIARGDEALGRHAYSIVLYEKPRLAGFSEIQTHVQMLSLSMLDCIRYTLARDVRQLRCKQGR